MPTTKKWFTNEKRKLKTELYFICQEILDMIDSGNKSIEDIMFEFYRKFNNIDKQFKDYVSRKQTK